MCNVTRACERSGAWSERGAERAKYSRSAERVFIQRLERSLCLAPVPLRYRSHHEPRACTNPPWIHLCLSSILILVRYSSNESSLNISKSKPTGHTGAQFLSKKLMIMLNMIRNVVIYMFYFDWCCCCCEFFIGYRLRGGRVAERVCSVLIFLSAPMLTD